MCNHEVSAATNATTSLYTHVKGGLGNTNARKKAEALQLQVEVTTDEEWRSVSSREGLLVADVYSGWCGPCSAMSHTLRKIRLELGDDHLTLATVCADRVTAFEKFRMKAEPTWLFFGGGKALRVVHGADGPSLVATIKELLETEKAVTKGQATRQTVLLESLVKPEEVLQPDEDLDDEEGERDARELEQSEEGVQSPIFHAVVFIRPHIVSTDQVEGFLEHMVAAGLVIVSHVQHELSREELHAILFLPLQDDAAPSNGDGSPPDGDGLPARKSESMEDNKKLTGAAGGDAGQEGTDEDDDLDYWEEELSKAPLYMLLLRAEEEGGNVMEQWFALLGPEDLEAAQQQQPQSLMAQFGSPGQVPPAWMPRGEALQQRLVAYAFPGLTGGDPRRLLLLLDTDHQQVLERLVEAGVRVIAHTQATLTEDSLAALRTGGGPTQGLLPHVGKSVFAAAVSGDESLLKIANDLGSLYLTPSADASAADAEAGPGSSRLPADDPLGGRDDGEVQRGLGDVAVFFPDLPMEQSQGALGPDDDPQTQMQIEQRRENIKT